VALRTMLGDRARSGGAWVWRCHQDLSAALTAAWDHIAPAVAAYDAAVFTMDGLAPPGYSGPPITVIAPSIDPLSAKNQWIDPDTIYEILHRFGVQWTRPIVTQVAPFHPSKDPLGVIDAYRLARDEVPDLQLALIGNVAREDPDSWHYLEVTERHRGDDPSVFVLSNLQGVGHLEVNAFQRDSRVVLQKSLREGFGLAVSEALWKGTPVVGGDVGGIRLQIEDGTSGFLVDSVEACAARLVELVSDEELRDRMGQAGRRRVRERFLALREIGDVLALLSSLGNGR
jgi:trehalose synthase